MNRRLRGVSTQICLCSALAVSACGEDAPISTTTTDEEICGLPRADGRTYCIDIYEASRRDATDTDPGDDDGGPARSLADRLPWVNVTWFTARAACAARGARLCDVDEWIDACDGLAGVGGSTYTYGDVRTPELCVLDGAGTRVSGSKATCVSMTGTLDQSGNVWEWVGDDTGSASARGGGFRSSQTHRCIDVRPSITVDELDVDLGFRCCRTE